MASAYQQQGCSSAMFKHLITKRQPVGVTSIITIAAGVREYSGAADGVGIVVTAAEVGGDFTGQLTVGSVSVCHCSMKSISLVKALPLWEFTKGHSRSRLAITVAIIRGLLKLSSSKL